MRRLHRLATRLSQLLTAIAAGALVFLMALSFCDVVGRYFFNTPIPATVELTELAMGLVVLLGLALTTLRRGHISVDLVTGAVPAPLRRAMELVGVLAGTVFVGLVAWQLWLQAESARGDGLATQTLFAPVYPIVYVMAAAASVAAAILVFQCATLAGGHDLGTED